MSPAPGPLSQALDVPAIKAQRWNARLGWIAVPHLPRDGWQSVSDYNVGLLNAKDLAKRHNAMVAALLDAYEAQRSELARRDALVQAPEVRALVDELRIMAGVVGQAALDTGESTGPADLMSKAADLLDALLEAHA